MATVEEMEQSVSQIHASINQFFSHIYFIFTSILTLLLSTSYTTLASVLRDGARMCSESVYELMCPKHTY